MHDLLITDGLAACVLLAVLAPLCLGFGYGVLIRIYPLRHDDFSSVFYAFATGAALIFWLMLVLAVFGLLNPATLGLLILLQAGVTAQRWTSIREYFIHDMRVLRQTYHDSWRQSSARIELLAVNAAIVLIFSLGFLVALIPTLEADGASSYLVSARLFWQHGGIIDVGYVIGNMAKGGFMPLIYGFALWSGILSQLWVFLILAVGVAFFHYYLTRHFSLFAASLTILVLISMGYHVDYSFGTAKLDNFSLAFAIVALIAWHHYAVSGSSGCLLINALAVGFLGSISYVCLAAGPVYFALMALSVCRQDVDFRSKMQRMLLWSAVACAVVMPGYAYNWIQFGNPAYPHLFSVFGHGVGEPHLDARGAFYNYMHQLYDHWSVSSVKEALMLPVDMWSDTEKFQTRGEKLFLLFALISLPGFFWLLARPGPRAPRHITLGIGAGFAFLYAIWTQQYILRYFSHALPLIFFLGACTIDRLAHYFERKRLLRILLLALACIAIFNVRALGNRARESLGMLAHLYSADRYLNERFSYSATDGGTPIALGRILTSLRGWLPPGAKVLYFLPGGFYLGDKIVVFNATHASVMPSKYSVPKPFYLYDTVPQLMRDLRDNGFDYIIIHPRYLYPSPQEKPLIDALLKTARPAFEVEGALAIEVKY